MNSDLKFVKFDMTTADVIRPWFDDADTKKRLGDRSWVDMELEQQRLSIGKEFRGSITLARYGWVIYDHDKPVGYIDAGVGDKYVIYGGMDGDKPVYLRSENIKSSGLAFVVNPSERGKGYAAQMISQLIGRPEYKEVGIFIAGVETDNVGSQRALENAGFKSDYKLDFEDMYYFTLRKTVLVKQSQA